MKGKLKVPEYPELEGTMALCNDIISERKIKLKHQREIAETQWTECDGCTETDKEFWLNGFLMGLNHTDPDAEYNIAAYWFGRGIHAGKNNLINELKPKR